MQMETYSSLHGSSFLPLWSAAARKERAALNYTQPFILLNPKTRAKGHPVGSDWAAALLCNCPKKAITTKAEFSRLPIEVFTILSMVKL